MTKSRLTVFLNKLADIVTLHMLFSKEIVNILLNLMFVS